MDSSMINQGRNSNAKKFGKLRMVGILLPTILLLLIALHQLHMVFIVFEPIDDSETMGSSTLRESHIRGLYKTTLLLKPIDRTQPQGFTISEAWVELASHSIATSPFFCVHVHVPSERSILCVAVDRSDNIFINTNNDSIYKVAERREKSVSSNIFQVVTTNVSIFPMK